MTRQFIHQGSVRAHRPPLFTLIPRLIANLLGLLGLLLGLPGLLLCTPTAQAQPSSISTDGPLAIVLADSEEVPLQRDGHASGLLQALEREGFTPLSNAQERLESHHSKPAQHLPKDMMQKLRESIDGVTRDLAMGDLPSAVTGMQAIDELHHSALVRLNRESKQARRLFTACVAMGVMLDDTGKSEDGVKRLHHCAVTFPGFRLSQDAFSPDAIALYQEVLQSIDPVVLRVDNLAPEMACTVRYNGLNVGAAPAQLRVHRGEATVQLECDEQPGRVHTVELVSERQRLAIDPRLEQAISATPQALRLRYETQEALQAHAVEHSLALIGTLNAAYAVLLQNDASGGHRLRLLQASQSSSSDTSGAPGSTGPLGGKVLATVSWDGQLSSLPVATRKLVEGSQRAQRQHTTAGARPNSSNSSNSSNEFASGMPSPGSTTLAGLPNGSMWVWPAVGLAYGASVGISLHNLHKRSQAREYVLAVHSQSSDAIWIDAINATSPGYDKRQDLSLAAASLSNVLFVASSTLVLPDSASTPWWAYVSGGVGLALAGTGAVLLGINSRCNLAESCSYAGSWDRDGSLPTLLLIHAAGPLSVPLTYLISQAFSGPSSRTRTQIQAHIQAHIQASPTSAALQLQGSF